VLRVLNRMQACLGVTFQIYAIWLETAGGVIDRPRCELANAYSGLRKAW